MCSTHRYIEKVANPSLSQMSFHQRTDTLSPNHWWDSSCEMVNGSAAKP